MDRTLVFDYMYKDEVCTHVEVNWTKQEVVAVDYTDNVINQAFGRNPHTIDHLLKFFESRCFPRERADKDVLLGMLGLTEYSPLEMCKRTHGLMCNEFSWIRFAGEDYTWEEIRTGEWENKV